jgi:hypothetical protein
MDFAKAKLLNSSTKLDDDKGLGSLACLSVRFTLEFDLRDKSGRELARTQIERHMRLCISATPGFETLFTTSGSEPYLAEAARKVMSDLGAVRHLAENSSLNCIDHGQRGELVAMLLIMWARDAWVSARGSREVSVNDFMQALLPVSAYERLKVAIPQVSQTNEPKTFSEVFKGYTTWFNHVIKVHKYAMINTEHLWKFVTRGAMVLCADNQRGVDIVIPVCKKDARLSRRTVTAILVQVKNDTSFSNKIDPTLFHGMNPFNVGLFSKGDTPLPVIRMVFALASEIGGVVIPLPGSKHHLCKFTAFDIWCAGVSEDAFRDISNDLFHYKSLLLRSVKLNDALDLKEVKDDYRSEETAQARGRLRRRMAPLMEPIEAHNHIHTTPTPG